MHLRRMIIPKSIAARADDKDMNFFLSAGHVSNELAVLNKLVLVATNYSSDEHIAKYEISQSLFLIRIACGKLHEAHELIRKGFNATQLSKKYRDTMGSSGLVALKNFQTYFSTSSNILTRLRNDYSFHYDPNNMTTNLEDLGDDDWCVYLTEYSGNSLYYISEVALVASMVKAMGMSDAKGALKRILEDLGKCINWFVEFSESYMVAFLNKHSSADDINRGSTVHVVKDAPGLREYRLPTIVKLP